MITKSEMQDLQDEFINDLSEVFQFHKNAVMDLLEKAESNNWSVDRFLHELDETGA